MSRRILSPELSSDLFLAVHDLVAEREGTVATVVESLLADHLESRKAARPIAEVKDERFVFALQKLLFRDLADASGWPDLDDRLRPHGYYNKIAWGGLPLHTKTNGQKLCSMHDLGFSYGTFVRRFSSGRPKPPCES